MPTIAPQDPAPPEGGWGWLIVLAAFLMNCLSYGIIRSVGVFFVEFVHFFDKSSGEVSWISSIAIAVQQFASPIGSAISSQYGERLVVMGGGILSCLGILLASLGNSLLHLYLGLGMLTGCGWALVFTPTMGMIPKYFTRRRVLALGLALTGNGISSFLFSPFFQVLIDNFSWRGALLILSAIVLNLCVCGALLRPPAFQGKAIRKPAKSEDASRGRRYLRKLSSIFDLSLFRNRGFAIYTVALLLIGTGYFIPYVHLVPHGTDLGLSSYEAAFLMSVTALADAVMRFVSGCFADLRLLSSTQLLFLWNTLTGLSLILLPFGKSYFSVMALGIFYGCSAGGFAPLIFAVVPDLVGVSRVTNAIGLGLMVMSFGGLLGPPLSGFLRDQTGNFRASFLICAMFILLGSCVLLGLPSFFSCASSTCLKRKTQDPTTPEEDPLSSSLLISKSTTDHSLRSSQITRLSPVLSDSSC